MSDDQFFKIVMVADPYVGNTAIFRRYVYGVFASVVIGELL